MADQRTGSGAARGGGAGVGAPPSMAAAALDPVRLVRVYYPWLIVAGVFGIALGVALHLVFAQYAPKWPGVVLFEVTGPPSDDPFETAAGEALERFIATQAAVMMSDTILQKAVKEDTVAQTSWFRQFVVGGKPDYVEALKALREIVSAAPRAETNLIELKVVTRSKRDAPEIVGAIKNVYLSDLRNQSSLEFQELQKNYGARLNELHGKKEQKDIAITAVMGNKNLESLDLRNSQAFMEMSELSAQMSERKATRVLLENNLADYDSRRLAPGGIVYPEAVVEAARQSLIAQQLEADIVSQKATLAALREQLGEGHRQVKAAERRIRSTEDAWRAQVDRDQDELFAAQYESLRSQLEMIRAAELEGSARMTSLTKELQDLQVVLNGIRSLEDERTQLMMEIAQYDAKLTELRVISERPDRVRVIQPEQLPDARAFPRLTIMVPAGFVLVMGGVGGYIVLKELREQRIRSAQDVALIPRTTVLGVVPDVSLDPSSPARVETAVVESPGSAIAETIKQVRTAVLRACAAGERRTVLFTSGEPGSGATTIVSNLAGAVASLDARVLVIDANLRKPRQHEVFGVGEGPGLAEVLRGQATIETAAVQAPGVPGVSVLAAGRDRSASLDRLNTRAMTDVLESAKQLFDFVLIDAPPATVSTDALSLASRCDASVVVVRAYREKRGLLARLRNQFGEARAEFLGVVLNAARPSAGGYLKTNIQATHEYGGRGGSTKAA